jgi:hypothetical protein
LEIIIVNLYLNMVDNQDILGDVYSGLR